MDGNKISRRDFLRLSALTAAGAALAGCGAPTPAPTEAPTEVPPEAPTEAPAVAERPACPDELSLELRMDDFLCADIDWRQFEGTEITGAFSQAQWADAEREKAQFFEELTGIHVNFQTFPELELHDKTFVDLVSGGGQFDTFDMDFMFIAQYVESGYLESMDKYLNDSNLCDLGWYDTADFFPAVWDATQYKGEMFAVNYFVETLILTYRKDLFSGVPDTFDDLMRLAGEATKPPDVYGFTTRGERGQGMNVYTWTSFLKGFGGDFFADFPDDMTPVVNSPEAVEATEFYAELLQKYGPPGQASFTWAETTQAFTEGKAASILEFSANPAVLDKPGDPWSGKCNYVNTPKGPAGRFASFFSFIQPISKASKNKEATWLYLMFKTSKAGCMHFTTGGAPQPVRYSTGQQSAYTESLTNQVTYPDVWLNATTEAFDKGYARADYRPIFPHWREMGDRLGIAVSAAIAGEGTAKEVLDGTQTDIEAMLKENGYL